MRLLSSLLSTVIFYLIVYFFCNIDANEPCVWYHGIWHGICVIPNFIFSWFDDRLCKAEIYTTAYNVWFWIFAVLSVLEIALPFLFGSSDD